MDAESFLKLSLDEKIKLAIFSKNSKELDVIARSTCDAAKIFAAQNPSTSPESLDYMATNSKCKTLINRLLDNPRLMNETRLKLADAS